MTTTQKDDLLLLSEKILKIIEGIAQIEITIEKVTITLRGVHIGGKTNETNI